jgi:adenine-specific DNA-methyltransferase
MIYIDPPYGIKFASNFQPEIGKRDVKDGRDNDLTREPEMVKAYRDTWHLGLHSYLPYLQARVRLAATLLSQTGSMFIQIGEENLGQVRAIAEEVMGGDSLVRVIPYVTTSYQADNFLGNVVNYLLWFVKDKAAALSTVRQIFRNKELGDNEAAEYRWVLLPDGQSRSLSAEELGGRAALPEGARAWRFGPITSQGYSEAGSKPFEHNGRIFTCGGSQHWKTNRVGLSRLARAGYLTWRANSLAHFMFLDAFPISPLGNLWTDTKWGYDAGEKAYVVQTNTKIVERCMLMTTGPGDLVLDPTCGSGTTALVAEQWGRRWLTIDTSRVAISIARHRILTASFDHYRTKAGQKGSFGSENPASGFECRVVPHITLGAIAQNASLDPILLKHEPLLAAKLIAVNDALAGVSRALRDRLKLKLEAKHTKEGKKLPSDADRRRWILPPDNREGTEPLTVPRDFAGWYEWEVPFDTDPDWPKPLQDAVTAYRKAWRAKMDEVNKCIADNAEQEELVDQPEVVKGVTRVSGPFTVEGVMPEELALTEDGIVDPTPNDEDDDSGPDCDAQNRSAYLKEMIDAIRRDGVLFPNNQKRMFSRVEPLYETHTLAGIHAEAAWEGEDEASVAICFGPQYGPVTAYQVEELIRATKRYAHLVIAGFSFDPEATAIIEQSQHPKLKIHMAHIRPDMNPGMRGLLKDTPNSQLFTVFGMPAVEVARTKDGEWQVKLEGVDIYDPVENTVRSTKAEKVAAWFLDSDFDGRCFCICQAFFPDQDAWEKIAKSLGSAADPEAFAAFKGTTSLAFRKGKHGRIAVKVIDPRGNEVMTVRKLEG